MTKKQKFTADKTPVALLFFENMPDIYVLTEIVRVYGKTGWGTVEVRYDKKNSGDIPYWKLIFHKKKNAVRNPIPHAQIHADLFGTQKSRR